MEWFFSTDALAEVEQAIKPSGFEKIKNSPDRPLFGIIASRSNGSVW
jgi:hypothetical protein